LSKYYIGKNSGAVAVAGVIVEGNCDIYLIKSV